MFVCPVPKISQVMMKWRRRASHLGRFTPSCGTHSVDILCGTTDDELHNVLAVKFTLWHNGRRAKQPGLMHAPGVAGVEFYHKKPEV